MTVCARCGDGKQEACGEKIPVTPTVVERACCDAQHIGPANPEPGTRPRASQTIPPAIRREVLRRHGGRCAVPGCTHSTFVEVHHLDRRSEGGTHDPLRLIPLCSAHHAAEHDGRLIIEGDAVSGFRFYHGDRTTYGAVTAPESTMAWADAFSMLKNLGFKEGEVRGALEAVRPELDRTADTEAIVRAGLRRLHLDRHEGARPRPAPPAPPEPPAPSASPAPPTPPASPTVIEASADDPRGSSDDPRGSIEVPADRPRGSSDRPRGSTPIRPPQSPDESPPHLARSTLVNLGFTRQEAREAVERALTHVGADAELEPLLRAALRHVPLGSRAREATVLYQAGPPAPRRLPTWAAGAGLELTYDARARRLEERRLQVNPVPPMRVRLAAVQLPTVRLDDLDRAEVVGIDCHAYGVDAALSGFLEPQREQPRTVSPASHRGTNRVSDVAALALEGIGQPMTNTNDANEGAVVLQPEL